MKMIFNVAIAVFVWLGIFERHLVGPLLREPLGDALSKITFVDIGLLVLTLIAVIAALDTFDKYLDGRKRKSISPQ